MARSTRPPLLQPREFLWKRHGCDVLKGWPREIYEQVGPNGPGPLSPIEPILVATEPILGAPDYEPLAHPDLLFEFATLRPESNSILEFARKWGRLGGPIGAEYRVDECRDNDGELVIANAESIRAWELEIEKAFTFLRIWKLAVNPDIEALRGHFTVASLSQLDPNTWVCIEGEQARKIVRLFLGNVLYANHERWTLPITPRTERTEQEDMQTAARTLCWIMVDRMLENCWVRPALLSESVNGPISLQLIPSSLLGCIWLQFARMLTSELAFNFCAACEKPLRLGTTVGAFRSNRNFCDDACRQLAYRNRIRRALAFRTEGRSLREIANLLDADVQTVRGWVQSTSKPSGSRKDINSPRKIKKK